MPNRVQYKMLEILSASMWGCGSIVHCADLWGDILDEMEKQTVAYLPGRLLSNMDLTIEQYNDYQDFAFSNFVSVRALLLAQSKVLELLSNNDIPVVVLKGFAAAMYYPQPEFRCMGDIDIIVLPKDFERAQELLLNSGYRIEGDGKNLRHSRFIDANDNVIELHRYFSLSNDKDIDSIIFSSIPNREYKSLFGFSIPILPPLENGIVLLDHINQHLSSGLGLRQIIDWMMYVDRYLDDEFWNHSFSIVAESLGLRKLAEVVTAMCCKYLGLKSQYGWCSTVEAELCDELLDYVLARGNFGSSDSFASNASINVLVKFWRPDVAFKYLQAGGRCHWAAISKYPWLRHIAWMYQIFHLIKMGFKHGIGPIVMSKSTLRAKRTASLMDKLGVTHV